MAGVTGANDLGGCVPAGRAASEMAVDAARRPERVRELQRRLWVAAKRSPGRRFHSLYDKLWRGDVLLEAWERVRRNKGASGVDGVTLAAVEAYGVERMLVELSVDLREGRYRPAPVRRVEIPKPQGGVRPLGIPVVRDRVCQQAARLVLEPIFEADFLPVSYGFRPRRSAVQAKEQARVSFVDGYVFAVDGDIRDYFSTIEHERLLALVAERVSDGRMLKLLGKWLEAGVMEDGLFSETVTGTPQGGVISHRCSRTSTCTPSTRRWSRRVLAGSSATRMTGWCSAGAVARPRRPWRSLARRWLGSGSSCTLTRREWLTSERAERASTSSAATSEPASRVGCWSAASAATTSYAGPHSER